MKSLRVMLVAMLATACLPAVAQGGYHYGYGGSRVVNQNQTGLYTPSSTYIGSGTMSKSAQGLPSGVSSGGMNNGLPVTKMGATVTTPGDSQYSEQVMRERLYGNRRPVVRNQYNMQQYYNQQQPQGHYYVPGQNGGAIRQGQFYAPQGYNQGQGGTATYAESQHYNVNQNGTFHY